MYKYASFFLRGDLHQQGWLLTAGRGGKRLRNDVLGGSQENSFPKNSKKHLEQLCKKTVEIV